MNSQLRELLNRAQTDYQSERPRWQTMRFWQEMFIYFWVFGIVGHYLEVIWAWSMHVITGNPMWHMIMSTIIPLAPPYGFGVFAVILIVIPLIKRYKLRPIAVFAVNTAVTGAVEYLCAFFIVLFAGYNRFWNYSYQPLNLNGYTSLAAALVFGILATIFVYCIYPTWQKLLQRIGGRRINVIFWVIAVTYVADLILTNLILG